MCMCVCPGPCQWLGIGGLGKTGLQGLLLELSLPKCLGSLSRSRAR